MVHEGKKLFKCDICDPIIFITHCNYFIKVVRNELNIAN